MEREYRKEKTASTEKAVWAQHVFHRDQPVTLSREPVPDRLFDAYDVES